MSNKVFYLKGVFTDRNTLFNINRIFTTFCDRILQKTPARKMTGVLSFLIYFVVTSIGCGILLIAHVAKKYNRLYETKTENNIFDSIVTIQI